MGKASVRGLILIVTLLFMVSMALGQTAVRIAGIGPMEKLGSTAGTFERGVANYVAKTRSASPAAAEVIVPVCPADTNLIISGRLVFKDLECTDDFFEPDITVLTQRKTECSIGTEPPQPTIFEILPVDDLDVGDCFYKPLKKARVSLFDRDILNQRGGASRIFTTTTDSDGIFVICGEVAPNSERDYFARVSTCADGSEDGDACGTQAGVENPFSVVVQNPDEGVYTTDSGTVPNVCTGAIHWDIVDRRANHNGAQEIYDLLTNKAFDYLDKEANFENDQRLRVFFPAESAGFSGVTGDIFVGPGFETRDDVLLQLYGLYLLHRLNGGSLPVSGCGTERFAEHENRTCAWIYGFGVFLQAAIQNDPVFDGRFNLETPIPFADHKESEGAVAATLWDLFDNGADPLFNLPGPPKDDAVKMRFADIWTAVQAEPTGDICQFLLQLNIPPDIRQSDVDDIFAHYRTSCISYAALGDSYSSGEGVRPYRRGSDVASPKNRCHRSTLAYSAQVRDPLSALGSFIPLLDEDMLACSGARTFNVVQGGSSPEAAPTTEPPQLARVYASDPGTFIVGDQTDLITLTIGGNDIGFVDILIYCFFHALCHNRHILGGHTYQQDILAKIEATRSELTSTYHELIRLAPNAVVFVLGYPQIIAFDPVNKCSQVVNFYTSTEIEFLSLAADKLNAAIREVAAEVGIHYVPVASKFVDHRVCETNTDLNDWIYPFKRGFAGSFHPKALGQRAYADALNDFIDQKIRTGAELTLEGLPKNPDPQTSPAVANAFAPEEVNVPLPIFGTLEVAPDPIPVCDSRGVYVRGQTIRVTGAGYGPGQQVFVNFIAENESIDLGLAMLTANGEGAIDSVLTLPANAPTSGGALIEAAGLTSDGGALLLFEVIGLGDTFSTDSDFDSIPDLCDNCPAVDNPDQTDTDFDGLGDRCDMCPMDLDNDLDRDNLCAAVDTCPFDPENDIDEDGVCGDADNCPTVANPGQEDVDGDSIGDVCDETS